MSSKSQPAPSASVDTTPRGAEPDWLKYFVSEEESYLVTREAELEQEIAERIKAKEEVSRSMQESGKWKQLFITSGDDFRVWVKKAFEELGMKVDMGPKGHADLIGRYGDMMIVIEAKAIAGAARKPDIGQAADYGDEIEQALEYTGDELNDHHREYLSAIQRMGLSADRLKHDKGLIKKIAVLNTNRNEPLDKRAEPAFPAVAVNEMKARAVSGLTGLQLFGIISACHAGRVEKSRILEEILSSIGQFRDFQNWQTFLTPRATGTHGSFLMNP